MKRIVNHTHYSKELILESYKEFLKVKHRLRNLVSLCLSIFILSVCTDALFDIAKGLQPFNYNYIIFAMAAFGLIWTVFGGYTSAARRTYDGMLQNHIPLDMSYSFNENGFSVRTADDVFDIQWRQCLFSILTERMCLISVKKKFYTIDLHGFTGESAEDFLKLVQRKTNVRHVKFL